MPDNTFNCRLRRLPARPRSKRLAAYGLGNISLIKRLAANQAETEKQPWVQGPDPSLRAALTGFADATRVKLVVRRTPYYHTAYGTGLGADAGAEPAMPEGDDLKGWSQTFRPTATALWQCEQLIFGNGSVGWTKPTLRTLCVVTNATFKAEVSDMTSRINAAEAMLEATQDSLADSLYALQKQSAPIIHETRAFSADTVAAMGTVNVEQMATDAEWHYGIGTLVYESITYRFIYAYCCAKGIVGGTGASSGWVCYNPAIMPPNTVYTSRNTMRVTINGSAGVKTLNLAPPRSGVNFVMAKSTDESLADLNRGQGALYKYTSAGLTEVTAGDFKQSMTNAAAAVAYTEEGGEE